VNKVICVGFHKTGTSSMGKLFRTLRLSERGAYKTRDTAFVDKLAKGDLEELFRIVDGVDAVRDNPRPLFYRELDERYPNSRFILTVREPQEWIRSVVNHFGKQKNPDSPMRAWIYGAGSPLGNEALYLERYQRHNREVQAYFRTRPEQLLVTDLSQGDAFSAICRFLGRRKPWFQKMPHKNQRRRLDT